ncbi:MAG: hypothetical protein U9R19_16180, partial [Bacteroidota bacterium]|nr:hypothetical protein [Bacteroidota bacterium]
YWFYKNDEKRRQHELRRESRKIIVPIRLQAYERLTLLLERISPENLLLRSQQYGMSSHDLQKELLRNIRSEFDHNLSQQVYVSHKTWEKVVSAKENVVKLINTNMIELQEKATAMELSRNILESMVTNDIHSPRTAIDFLKKEAALYF